MTQNTPIEDPPDWSIVDWNVPKKIKLEYSQNRRLLDAQYSIPVIPTLFEFPG